MSNPYNGRIVIDDIYTDEDDEGNTIIVVTFKVRIYDQYIYVHSSLKDAIFLYNDLSGSPMWGDVYNDFL